MVLELKKLNTKQWILVIFIILAILVVANLPKDTSSKLNEFGESYDVDKTSACIMARQFVEGRLKAPSTSKFESCYDATIVYLGNQTYEVRSYVDSQNSFGAMIRTNYYVKLKDLYEDYWEELNFSDY